MHGLIFVTWEKYLQDRFEGAVFSQYREKLGLNAANSPLAVRTYPDELLLKGVGTAHEITGVPVDTLLQEYGHYFIINGLTRHRCAYLLSQSPQRTRSFVSYARRARTDEAVARWPDSSSV